ncbi:MAG: aldehyde dehydrogenase [Caldilineales bacterium]|nr:aldehyde dehydrogenase [Caldilineales bacterium]
MPEMYIAGRWTAGSASEHINIIDPATEEVLASVPRGTSADAQAAVAAAKDAFDDWRRTSANERADMLHEAANLMREHFDELATLLTREEGKPYSENEEEMEWTLNTFHYYAELGRHEIGSVIPPGDPAQFNFVIREPYGVAACIIPWNYPLLLLAWKVAPALAAGNTVVIKPSELTPLATLRLAELAFAHLPPGVVNVVTGFGPEVGEPLVRHPDVPVIAFTGSVATGQRIASIAAPMMKKLHLELGGKDPMVIAPDMEIETAVSALAYAALLNAGQVCTSTERVYVHQSQYAAFSEELASFVSSLRLGNGLDENVDIGPMIEDRFRDKVAGHIAEAVSRGARVLVGGGNATGFDRGYFFQPTVLIDANHSMKIMREETFGPAIPLMPYRDFDEAIRLCNDSALGLGATLMSHDARLVKRFFENVKAGTIWINDPLTDNYAGPFGGMKMTGGGRELGQAGFDEFTEIKHVHWDIEGGIKDYWFPY